ncbi:N-acyl-D-amino-acid deacylase family protein [Paraburkholderia phytofirmans]|uniref:N-acyl-D-amino-acid deacylase family protein n=1 Tax=Paraburkholderia phytofirmans TaxID=261302 RepID=UPI0038BA744D
MEAMKTSAFDLVVRGGTVVDGNGTASFEADVAVTQGKITAIGKNLGSGAEEIDARGCLVTPGFIDLHTHLDGHVTWEQRLKPCSGHGITTAIMGNCGVGFAPARPADHDALLRLMEGVEDIPFKVLKAGLPWAWETFPEYLDFLSQRQYDMDVGTLLPHSMLRAYVMGERGIRGESAGAEEIAQMATLASEASGAGALGFASSRLTEQRAKDGSSIPSLRATEDELLGIARGLRSTRGGTLQMAIEFNEFPGAVDELSMFIRVARESGLPAMYSLKQSNRTPAGWRELLALTARANDDGAEIHPQVLGRPTGAIITLDATLHPFARCPGFEPLAKIPLRERVERMRNPELRARLIAEATTVKMSARSSGDSYSRMFRFAEPLQYEPDPATSVAAYAKAQGVASEAVIYDWLMENEGTGQVLYAAGNFADGNLNAALEMMRVPSSVPGLGDGGAHSTFICDASAPTYMLTYWARDRTRGEKMSVPEVVRKLTRDGARAVGLHDRGVLAPGYKADLNVIDHDRLTLHSPRLVVDLPADGRRMVQGATGYVATVVSGKIVRRNDEETAELPGRLVRGVQSAP